MEGSDVHSFKGGTKEEEKLVSCSGGDWASVGEIRPKCHGLGPTSILEPTCCSEIAFLEHSSIRSACLHLEIQRGVIGKPTGVQ